jgi:alpha-mannosidase
MTLETELLLPVDLAARAGGATKTLSVRLQCELRKYDPHLYVAIDLENTVCDHRLRLLINSDITTRHTLASQPFSIIRRQAGVKNDRWRQQYREFPVDIETSEGIIAVEDAGKALIINSQGMKEFQLHGTEPAQVALTLFKATGVLGRDDLAWRPGRASGSITPLLKHRTHSSSNRCTFLCPVAGRQRRARHVTETGKTGYWPTLYLAAANAAYAG